MYVTKLTFVFAFEDQLLDDIDLGNCMYSTSALLDLSLVLFFEPLSEI